MNIRKPLAINQPEVGQLVRELRSLTGLTQEQFAAALGVTYSTVNRWENGRSKPSSMAIKLIEKMLQELGDTPSESLRERGQELLDKYFDSK